MRRFQGDQILSLWLPVKIHIFNPREIKMKFLKIVLISKAVVCLRTRAVMTVTVGRATRFQRSRTYFPVAKSHASLLRNVSNALSPPDARYNAKTSRPLPDFRGKPILSIPNAECGEPQIGAEQSITQIE